MNTQFFIFTGVFLVLFLVSAVVAEGQEDRQKCAGLVVRSKDGKLPEFKEALSLKHRYSLWGGMHSFRHEGSWTCEELEEVIKEDPNIGSVMYDRSVQLFVH